MKTWAEVLEVRQPDADDNFFWLGGDSLSTIEVIRRINEKFRIELPPTCPCSTGRP